MPLTISDRKMSQLYNQLETNKGKIDDAKALEFLAEVGDRTGASAASILRKLKDPNVSREEKVALIKKGMTPAEKKDLQAILAQSAVKMDATAKTFFEAVAAVTPPPPPPANGNLAITGDQANGFTGSARPGDKIEAINISAAPTGRLHMDDTTVIGTAGADGRFSGAKLTGDQTPKEGDLIRMRARHADGTTGDWVTVKATGIAPKDTRNAEVALFRIGLSDAGGGKVNVTNINESRQISEPGAKLQFTNKATGEKTVVTIDEKGGFPAGFSIKGKPGDEITVAATDGINNANYATSIGQLKVAGGTDNPVDLIPDPALHKDELDSSGKPKFTTERFTGPLFKEGVKPTDAVQGQIGDCYFPSAIAAIAVQNPEILQDMIKDNGDGTYTVTFKERDRNFNYKDVEIKVDGDLYVRSWGGPLYGASSTTDRGNQSMELWFPLVEKAYAQWKGSYNEIGNGGHSSEVMQDVMGKDGRMMGIDESNGNAVFAQLKKAFDSGQPVSAGTYGEDQEARYTNTGVYADHSYSVMGYSEKNGEKFIKLRNPWGESEPAGNGPNDGIFEMKLSDFSKLYATLYYTNP